MAYNQENRRLAKNTAYMYLRMGITLIVGLYTSRVVLSVLGVDDFGLYNVIGGIIAMFMFLNNAMVNTTSRFITVRLANGTLGEQKQIFNMALLIHVIIALIVLVMGETVGLWYVQNKLVVPEGREFAAMWLYQLSVISCIISIIIVPYNAEVIAHEKMNVYAAIQIMDVLLKLVIVIALQYAPFDKLIFYGTLLACVSMLDLTLYFIYCRRFSETKLAYYWEKSVFKEMMGFAGWAFVGNFSYLFYTQGLNLMLNAFCGPAVNAARGIAVQVESVVKQFANNVQVSINPQILKTYATNEMERMHALVCASSRYCYFLLLLISLPVMLEAEFLLQLWLGEVPAHTVNFIRIILVVVLLDAFINPMFTANLATGKLKQYYIPVFSLSFSFMFITFFSIKLTRIPEIVFLCYFVMVFLGVIIRIFVMNKQIHLTPSTYLKKVILPAIVVTVLSVILPLLTHVLVKGDWLRLIATLLVSAISVGTVVYLVGITKGERQFVNQFVGNRISSIARRKM